MKTASTTALIALSGLALQAHAATFVVKTCKDLKKAARKTFTEDTVAQISPSNAVIDCNPTGASFVTLAIGDNALTVEVVDDGVEGDEGVTLSGVRFEVAGKLLWSPKATFNGTTEQDLELDGGWLNVAEGAKARFYNDISVNSYTVTSVTEEGTDFTKDQWDGGCVWNQGYFRVDGAASFISCGNKGGGESNPGKGGAIFNGETGSILFVAGVTIENVRLTDDEGNDGGGIYNEGKVNIKGASTFYDVFADTSEASGGAIYNAEGAQFYFKSGATASFSETRAGLGGALYNAGTFKFSGPATFSLCDQSAIYNVGTLKLSEGSVFSDNSAEVRGGAVTNLVGGTIDIPDTVTFTNNVVAGDPKCPDIYLQKRAQTYNSDGTVKKKELFECFP